LKAAICVTGRLTSRNPRRSHGFPPSGETALLLARKDAHLGIKPPRRTNWRFARCRPAGRSRRAWLGEELFDDVAELGAEVLGADEALVAEADAPTAVEDDKSWKPGNGKRALSAAGRVVRGG